MKVEPSVGSVGDSYDNAMAEMVNGLYKGEGKEPGGPCKGIEDVESRTLEWVDFRNKRRLLGPIGTSRRPSWSGSTLVNSKRQS